MLLLLLFEVFSPKDWPIKATTETKRYINPGRQPAFK